MFLDKVTHFLKNFKFTIITLVLILLSIFIILEKASIVTGAEVFLPGYKTGMKFEDIEEPSVKALVEMTSKFGNVDSIIFIVPTKTGKFDKNVDIKRIEEIQSKLEKTGNFVTLISIANHPDGREFLESPDTSNIPQSLKSFISQSGKYLTIVGIVKADIERNKFYMHLEKMFSGTDIIYVSEGLSQYLLFKELQKQIYIYPVFMFLVIFALFYLQTQSFRAALLSLFIPLLATIYTYAIYFLTGNAVNTLTAMIPSFLLIIGSAYPLHYYNALHRSSNVRKELLLPILFSMLTTAVGFLSFLFVTIPAFRYLGMYVSLGLFFVFSLTFTLGHELFSHVKNRTLKIPLDFGIRFVGRKGVIVVGIATAVAIVLAIYLIPKLDVGLTSMDYFGEKTYIKRGYKLLEKEFGFNESIYLVLSKEEAIFIPADQSKVHEIIEKISKLNGVSSVDFPTGLPINSLNILSRAQPILRNYVADGRTIRMRIDLSTEGYKQMNKVKEEIEKFVSEYGYKYTVAGAPFVWKAISDSIVKSQLQSLFSALVLVFVMLIVLFRSIKEALVLIIPVLVSTVLNFMNMKLFGMKLEISTAITASIIIGLAIDYSIHLGHDVVKTLSAERSVKNVGPAILGNALGIAGGFSVLLVAGELAMFRRTSTLVILGISTATALTLTVVPYLLGKIFEKRR